jgi:hypothetical protein
MMNALRLTPMLKSIVPRTLTRCLQTGIFLAMIVAAFAFGRECSLSNRALPNPVASAFLDIRSMCSALTAAANPEETPFLAENSAAMTKMMAAMVVKPSGDIDKDFVAMMTPHHQGAIDMALALLRYGHNEQLRRLAQEIIVTQQQEIAVMQLAARQPLVPLVVSTAGGPPR